MKIKMETKTEITEPRPPSRPVALRRTPPHSPALPREPRRNARAAGASKTVTSIMEFEASFTKGRRQILIWLKIGALPAVPAVCDGGSQPAECTQTERQRVAGLRVRRLRPARLIRAANRPTQPPPDRKNKPQPAERHSYSSSSKCHNLIRPRAAAARRRKNASSNQHDNPSPMIKRYDPQRYLRCLRPFRE